MNLQLRPREQRILALLLAAMFVIILYWSTVQCWVISPLQDISEEMSTLREAQRRYVSLIAQRDALEAQLVEARQQSMNTESMLVGSDASTATAQLMELVSARLHTETDTGSGCTLANRTPLAPEAVGGMIQIKINIDLICGIEALAGTLYRLETEQPYLFVESLTVRRNDYIDAKGASNQLSAQLLISGFLSANTQGLTDE